MTDVVVETEMAGAARASEAAHGAVLFIPLNRLKPSPRNARKTPHASDDIEALAGSIAAKAGVQPSQPPVVEPEAGDDEAPTGFFLVTIGEGRRQALILLAKRKVIRKTHPVRCLLDIRNDPQEISLDENVTRAPMHPADQFEAFRDQAERRGLSAEEIAARFGVKAQTVRQRLRLGAASPVLIAAYRAEDLTLEQLMAFCLTDDRARQEQVYAQLIHRSPHAIRRAITEDKVAASDRRAQFVGLGAYAEAGGPVLRDLFTEDGGGWLEDVGLLDRLVAEKLDALAQEVREREGWKWAEAHVEYPHSHGHGRVYPGPVIHTDEQREATARLNAEQDALASQWEAVEELPPDIEQRFQDIEAELAGLDGGEAYASDDLQRAGVFVVLGHNGEARIERGLVRAEDEPPEPENEDYDGGSDAGDEGGEGPRSEADEPEDDGLAPLPERLVADLTAHRTLGLRDALARQPTLALTAVVHALALRAFYPAYDQPSCLALRLESSPLEGHAPGLSETALGRALAERHEAWAKRMPKDSGEAWAFVSGLDGEALLDLLAYCAGTSVNAVRVAFDRKPGAWAHADALAQSAALDMRQVWTPTVDSYLGRVTKARIREAVAEGVSPEAADRIADLKKPEIAQAAEDALLGKGWLPPLLRTDGLPKPEAARIAAE
jgi:ParB family chromosome partitioning protein